MRITIAIFVAGMLEFLLAAYWTRLVVRNDVLKTAATTFASCMLWGFAVTQLDMERPHLLITHGFGCATGAALCCALAGRRSEPAGTGAGHRALDAVGGSASAGSAGAAATAPASARSAALPSRPRDRSRRRRVLAGTARRAELGRPGPTAQARKLLHSTRLVHASRHTPPPSTAPGPESVPPPIAVASRRARGVAICNKLPPRPPPRPLPASRREPWAARSLDRPP